MKLVNKDYKDKFMKKLNFVIFLFIILLFCVIRFEYSKYSLKKELMRDWEVNNVNQSKYYEKELDFSDKTINYKYVSKDADIVENIDTFTYKVISSDEIKIDGKGKYKIEFNDDKNIMTVKPGIIENTDFEFWYNNDEVKN